MFCVSLNLKGLLWNKEICFYSSVPLCFPFFSLSPHTSFLNISTHESTLFRLFPHFFLGTFVETMKPRAPVSSGCRHELTLLPRGWGPESPELSHPLSFPISCYPMRPGHTRAVCAQQKASGSLMGLSNICPPP